MENRPKIYVKKELLDWGMEIIGSVVLIAAIIFVVIYYGGLPEKIPTHYGLDGNPDGFGSKSNLLILLTVTVSMYIGLFVLNKFPHLFNYPTPITAENAHSLYQKASRLIRSLNMVIVICFSYMIYSTIQTALNNQGGLGNYFTPVLLISVFGLIIYYLIQSFRAGKTT